MGSAGNCPASPSVQSLYVITEYLRERYESTITKHHCGEEYEANNSTRGKTMKRNSTFAVTCAVTLLASLCVFASGCAHWPATPRLEQAGGPGYRLAEVTRPGQSDDLLRVLAISGGGTRAAALGYGVLEELRRTEVMVNGVKRRLLDEVDVISVVSGGTLPATYYSLRGEKTFEEFEAKVLSRNFERELALRIVTPTNWFRLPSGTFGKSDLFAELYDETVFDHATFGDLQRANGPFVS